MRDANHKSVHATWWINHRRFVEELLVRDGPGVLELHVGDLELIMSPRDAVVLATRLVTTATELDAALAPIPFEKPGNLQHGSS